MTNILTITFVILSWQISVFCYFPTRAHFQNQYIWRFLQRSHGIPPMAILTPLLVLHHCPFFCVRLCWQNVDTGAKQLHNFLLWFLYHGRFTSLCFSKIRAILCTFFLNDAMEELVDFMFYAIMTSFTTFFLWSYDNFYKKYILFSHGKLICTP